MMRKRWLEGGVVVDWFDGGTIFLGLNLSPSDVASVALIGEQDELKYI